jgi:hypothetical protein
LRGKGRSQQIKRLKTGNLNLPKEAKQGLSKTEFSSFPADKIRHAVIH